MATYGDLPSPELGSALRAVRGLRATTLRGVSASGAGSSTGAVRFPEQPIIAPRSPRPAMSYRHRIHRAYDREAPRADYSGQRKLSPADLLLHGAATGDVLRAQEVLELRRNIERTFAESWLGDSAELDRERCIEVLLSIDCTLPEANAVLQDFPADQTHISVKDFLDLLFLPRQAATHYATGHAGYTGTIKSMEAEIEMLQKELKEAQQQAEEKARVAASSQAENEMLKKGLKKAQQQVGAVNVTLYITLKDQPAVTADTNPIESYHGQFRDDAERCVISFPGKYPSGWGALVKAHHDSSIGCVFLVTPDDGLGKHDPDPEAEDGSCYCKAIYGERSWKEFHYLKVVKCPYTQEQMDKEQAEAAVMCKVVVAEDATPEERQKAEEEAKQKYEENQRRAPWGCAWFPAWMKNGHKAVEKGQKLQVVFFAGQKGQGKVHWNDLPRSELWNGKGLGGSQKGEVAYLDKMGWEYEEIDVMQFLQSEFKLGQQVDARYQTPDKKIEWRRGWIIGVPPDVGHTPNDPKWEPEWTVECYEDPKVFQSTHVMHTTGPIDEVVNKVSNVGKGNLQSWLQEHLPEGVNVQYVSRCRLEHGDAALAVNVCVPEVKAMHVLRDKVLCGDLDVRLSGSLAYIHPVQVDKTKFFEQYESSLQSLSKLTEHQESKLRQLHEKKSKGVHLSAPAGAGKTFVAVQFALDKIYEKWESQEPILYVAPRPSLGLHFVHWLIERHLWLGFNGGNVKDLLPRIVLMHQPFEKFVILTLQENQLKEERTVATKYALAIFDEAHEIFTGTSDDNMTGIYKDLQADQKLLLSDRSQSGSRFALPDDVEDNVNLDEVVRSTRRIVAAAQAFELEKTEGVTTTCRGTAGPPLKTFIFKAPDSTEQMYTKYCEYTKQAIWHVRKSYPGLRSLHRRVAIIVPDNGFCHNLKKLLGQQLKSTSPGRKLRLESFEESLRYLHSHDHDERTTAEALVLDTIEEARGQEMMVSISVGLDEKIADTDRADPLLTRARIYQGITRAQLMAIVIDRMVEGGWFQFLATLKFSNQEFMEELAFGDFSPKAASSIVKTQEEASRDESPKKTTMVKFKEAEQELETSVWDVDSNETEIKSQTQNLQFDPRMLLQGGEFIIVIDKTNGERFGLDVDHEDGRTLAVDAITGGLIQKWNEEHPDKAVRPKDRIVEVNGLRGDVLELVDEMKKPKVLKIHVKRE